MRIVSREAVEERLDLDRLIDALAAAHEDLSAGNVSMPSRNAALVAERDGMLLSMPAYLPSAKALTTKLVTLFPQNESLPTHQAIIVAFDPATGAPVALLDGTAITAARTGAAAALSTRLLAREDARILAVLGTGVQARSHVDAFRRVRDFTEIRVASREVERAAAFAETIGGVACASYEEAVRGADVVAATTHAAEPVVRREWLSPGTHVTSVGFNPNGREVAPEVVRDAYVVVESRDAAFAPFPAGSNDLLGVIEPAATVELGEHPSRENDEQITLYKSVGLAIQDAAAVALVLGA